MGALYGRECYASADVAQDALLSATEPAIGAEQGTFARLSKSGGAWSLDRFQVDQNGNLALVSSSPVPAGGFAACDATAPFFDGMSAGWAVVAAMAVAWGVVMLRRGL